MSKDKKSGKFFKINKQLEVFSIKGCIPHTSALPLQIFSNSKNCTIPLSSTWEKKIYQTCFPIVQCRSRKVVSVVNLEDLYLGVIVPMLV
jgi:hypothetical protein